MATPHVGRIARVPLRDVWRHEALNFTTWLENNVDVLNDVLDFSIENVEREQSAGAFSVDLVGEDEAGRTVIIENQLERSNHDHLGKVVTYLTALEAGAAIWIVSEPRPEHTRAVSWLNEHPGASFYLVKVEALRIEGSPPAPLMTLIVGPSHETRGVGKTKREIDGRHKLRLEFWTGLLERARRMTKLHAAISPSKNGYVTTSSGIRGVIFSYVVHKHGAQVELYIDRGQGGEQENLTILQEMQAHQAEIEAAFGEPLEWQRLHGKRACRIAKPIPRGGYRDDRARWPQIQDSMVDAMVRLERALKPHISQLSLDAGVSA